MNAHQYINSKLRVYTIYKQLDIHNRNTHLVVHTCIKLYTRVFVHLYIFTMEYKINPGDIICWRWCIYYTQLLKCYMCMSLGVCVWVYKKKKGSDVLWGLIAVKLATCGSSRSSIRRKKKWVECVKRTQNVLPTMGLGIKWKNTAHEAIKLTLI